MAGTERDQSADVGAPGGQIPAHHRRRWVILTVVGLLVAVAAVTGGPWVYARVVAADAPEPLALSTPSAEPTLDPATPIDPDGTWRISAGSQAGYRIEEVLKGAGVEVVGRTDQVSGSATVIDGVLSAATVVVDAASVSTDQSARDLYFRRALDTTTYPEATFELSEPVDISDVADSTDPVQIEVFGQLTMGAATVDVTAELRVQRNADGLEVAGTIPVLLEDLGLAVPDLGFVTVSPEGSVEFLLLLSS